MSKGEYMVKKHYFSLPAIYSDGMILKQNKPIYIHGTDEPNQTIRVLFQTITYETKTNVHGKWSIKLDPHPAGGPYTLNIDGSELKIIHDVYVGEVWLIGGQSNMELPINRTYDEFKEEIDAANDKTIRQFHVPQKFDFIEPQTEMTGGKWKAATQENIQEFSALGYFYAKELQKEINVPIGIVHTAVGGTPIEAWMSEESLREIGGYEEDIHYWRNPMNINKEQKLSDERNEKWYKELSSRDMGLKEEWWNPNYNTSDWKEITIPVMFKDTELKDISGAVWLRKEFYLKEEHLKSTSFRLRLGSLINGDTTYLNGQKIGETGYRYPPRKYKVEKKQLNIGKNTLVIRLTIDANNGGFIPTFPYQLEMEEESVRLDGKWSYKIGIKKDILEPMLFLHYKPTGLYNGMLYPLKGYHFSGMLFYQGESNTKAPDGYAELMKYMVADWRNLFGEELPFYYVQLANYLDPAVGEDDQKWAILRNEQARARNLISNSEMIPALDVGLSYELHPYDKKTLAKRLLQVSLDKQYGKECSYENPEIIDVVMNLVEKNIDLDKTYKSNKDKNIKENRMKILEKQKKTKLTLYLKGIKGELVLKNGKQPLIEVCTKEGEWILVDVEINSPLTIDIPLKDQEACTSIQAVRYAWRNDPIGLLIDSSTKLPLLPFFKKFK